jgi:nitrate reductase NapD
VEAENIGALHKLSQEIEKTEGVLGLYPSYVTTEDEDE